MRKKPPRLKTPFPSCLAPRFPSSSAFLSPPSKMLPDGTDLNRSSARLAAMGGSFGLCNSGTWLSLLCVFRLAIALRSFRSSSCSLRSSTRFFRSSSISSSFAFAMRSELPPCRSTNPHTAGRCAAARLRPDGIGANAAAHAKDAAPTTAFSISLDEGFERPFPNAGLTFAGTLST